MSNGAKRNKKIGTIRWAIVLAFIVTFFFRCIVSAYDGNQVLLLRSCR